MIEPFYGPPPWHLIGRAMSVLCRLENPADARAHVATPLGVAADPIVRIRFWDLIHDSGFASSGLVGATPMTQVREGVVAFPVSYRGAEGDYPAHMYADDPIYTAFGRETMGWPLRDGIVRFSRTWLRREAASGTRLTAVLERHGQILVRVDLTLTGDMRDESEDIEPPRWFVVRRIPGLDGPSDSIRELAVTGPSRFRFGRIHSAKAEIEVNPYGELGWLRPREIVSSELWSGVDVTIGYGSHLLDLR